MKISVLSGKGGAGKTFISVNLAFAAKNAAYIDCDTEEPNGRLFLKPVNCQATEVFRLLPGFDKQKCSLCRKCVDFCRFNALACAGGELVLFSEICHSCGACVYLCPNGAVLEQKHAVGVVEHGKSGDINVVTGILNTGEASAMPVIKAALQKGQGLNELLIIDCPPGSGCAVIESVAASDCAIIAAEPTAFGFHNFLMVYKLVRLLKKPLYVVINKEDTPYKPLNDFCAQNNVSVAARIPYSHKLAQLGSKAFVAAEESDEYLKLFRSILTTVGAFKGAA